MLFEVKLRGTTHPIEIEADRLEQGAQERFVFLKTANPDGQNVAVFPLEAIDYVCRADNRRNKPK